MVTRGNHHDAKLLPRLLNRQEFTAGRYLLTDAGYDSKKNLRGMWERGVIPLVNLNKRWGLVNAKPRIR